MYAIAKDWDTFNFEKCQYLVDFSKKSGQMMRGHVLLWMNQPKHNPKFVNDEYKSVAQLEEFLMKYVKATVQEFGDDIFAWDVVNEAANGASTEAMPLNTENVFSKVDDVLCKTFKAAHEANPKIQLFYNDFGIMEYQNKANAVYTIVKDLVDRGCPIHGVGF